MHTSWKIFRIVNIIEVVLIAGFMVVGLFSYPVNGNYSSEITAYAIICCIPLFTAINCIQNMLLCNFLLRAKRLSIARSFFFWIGLVLFLAVVAMALFSVYSAYEAFSRLSIARQHFRLGEILVLLLLSFIALAGIYIMISQVILFFRIKRNYRLSRLEIVAGIGKISNNADLM